MAMLKPHTGAPAPRKAREPRKAVAPRKVQPITDLRLRKDSEAFKVLEQAYDEGERMSTVGMSSEEFLDALFGKPNAK